MAAKLSPKAKKALSTVVRKFQSGDLSPLVDVARVKLAADAPAAKWSFSNLVLAYAQTNCMDCRGYRQWQAAGRQVRRGSHGAFIFGPRMMPELDDNGDKTMRMRGVVAISVHPITNTDGDDTDALTYEPAELPPLADIAANLGIAIRYQPLLDAYGLCDHKGTTISLGTHDVKTFFHELAHAIHSRIDGGLIPGQDAHQETIAEFTATVLMRLYGLGDRTGNAWRYISYYSDDPLTAITRACGKVEQVLETLEGLAA